MSGRAAALRRRHPSVQALFDPARTRTRRFADDFVAGGVDDDLCVARNLVKCAADAGAKALVLTLDVPVRSKRNRDVRNGLSVPFRARARTLRDVAQSGSTAARAARRDHSNENQ
ncbi:MAG: alpha-hydroxy-acid oxidizing protein [Pararhizobium sp.]